MVSGTPLCSTISDLHGELNFLQVWPFCLSNAKDGFWEAKIGKPFEQRSESALQLLYALMDVVMMRHRY
jgi:E3 ubiquitin-protein ligase SHPRH